MARARALLAAVVAVTAGCRFEPAPPPPPWPAPTGAPALPYRLGLAPVRVAQEEIVSRHAGQTGRHAATPDPEVVRRELLEALRSDGAFARVEPRGGKHASPGAVERELWEAHDDLVLEVSVQDCFDEYLGHCNYVGWFVTYATFVWPAWWVAVDTYGAGLRADVRLRSVQARAEPLLERSYEVRPAEVAQELTPSDRELVGLLDWLALWNVDASLSASNWAAIERIVLPHALRALSRRVLADVRASIVPPLAEGSLAEREPVLRRVRKRLAVVAGVSAYADAAVGGGAHGADDARAFAQALAAPQGGGLVPGRDLLLLTDEQATSDALLGAIAAVASRATPVDEVVVYVAAAGTTFPAAEPAPGGPGRGDTASAPLEPGDDADPALLLHDARVEDLRRSALGLRRLGEALRAVPAARVLVVIDGALGGHEPGSRSFAAPSAPVTGRAVADALGLGPARVALLASRPGRPARNLPGAGTSLFAEALRAGIGGAADADQDGRVALVELARHARDVVTARAALEGFEQEPAVLGPVDDVPLGWPR